MLSLFEGLTRLNPANGTPMAVLATHYEVTPDGLRYIFYLRDHPALRGIRLPDTLSRFPTGQIAAGAESLLWALYNKVDFVFNY